MSFNKNVLAKPKNCMCLTFCHHASMQSPQPNSDLVHTEDKEFQTKFQHSWGLDMSEFLKAVSVFRAEFARLALLYEEDQSFVSAIFPPLNSTLTNTMTKCSPSSLPSKSAGGQAHTGPSLKSHLSATFDSEQSLERISDHSSPSLSFQEGVLSNPLSGHLDDRPCALSPREAFMYKA